MFLVAEAQLESLWYRFRSFKWFSICCCFSGRLDDTFVISSKTRKYYQMTIKYFSCPWCKWLCRKYQPLNKIITEQKYYFCWLPQMVTTSAACLSHTALNLSSVGTLWWVNNHDLILNTMSSVYGYWCWFYNLDIHNKHFHFYTLYKWTSL